MRSDDSKIDPNRQLVVVEACYETLRGSKYGEQMVETECGEGCGKALMHNEHVPDLVRLVEVLVNTWRFELARSAVPVNIWH